MAQSVSSSSPLLGNRYEIQPQTDQKPERGKYFAKDTLKGDLCIVQKIKAASASQASVYRQHIQKDAKRLMSLKSSQVENVRACFVKDTSLFIVKDQVVGVPYRRSVASTGRLSEEAATTFLEQVLSILGPLHREGLIHRNLSPESIYLRTADQLPVLTQFHFLQEVIIEAGHSHQPSFHEQAFQLTGLSVDKGIKQDLYALTLTAIVLLTGQPLANLFNPQTQTWDWEDYQLATDDFSTAINRMLSPHTADWFGTASEFLSEISGSIPTEPSVSPLSFASQTTPASTPQTPARSHARPSATQHSTKNITTNKRKNTPAPGGSLALPKNNIWIMLVGGGVALSLTGLVGIKLFDNLNTPPTRPEYANVPTTNTNNGNFDGSSLSTISSTDRSSNTTPAVTTSFDSSQAVPEAESSTSPTAQLTEGEAAALIRSWLRAKRDIFASPFDADLASELTTGELYHDITKPGGSIDWLRNNGAYYRFGTQNVQPTGSFSLSGDTATITVRVTEDRTLYTRGRRDSSQSGQSTTTTRYELALENGTWKISDYNYE